MARDYRRCYLLESRFEILVREPEIRNRLRERLSAGEPAEQHVPAESRTIEHDADRHQALVVCDLRLQRVELRETVLERAERHGPADRLQPAPRRFGIAAVEVLREAFVQPGRDVPAGDGIEDRVRQLVDEHLLEQLRFLRGAGDRNPDAAVVLAV